MTEDKFRLEARRLVRKGTVDRSKRAAEIDALIDSFVSDNGRIPPPETLSVLTDFFLLEELKDSNPYKSTSCAFPIFSSYQLRLRSGREVPLTYVSETVPSDSVDLIFYDTDDLRLRAEISAEVSKYTDLNRLHPVYTRLMTEEEAAAMSRGIYVNERGRSHAEWSLDVRRRDGFTCQKCGKRRRKGLHAHHIEAFNVAIDLRYDTANGITLCKSCHSDFHAIYGRGGNTRDQLNEWMGDSFYEL